MFSTLLYKLADKLEQVEIKVKYKYLGKDLDKFKLHYEELESAKDFKK